MTKLRTLDDIIQEELKDEQSRNEYLEYAVEDYFESGDEVELLLAIRQVVIAGIGFTALSERTGLSRESLYKTLSGKVNPKLKTLQQILSALGYAVTVKRKSA
ncbi:MAG: addiction module antidote protein [Deferribacterales bacterium]